MPTGDSGARDRIAYSPYGEATRTLRSDVNGDGFVNQSDYSGIIKPRTGATIGTATYVVEADLDRDGKITQTDYDICIADDGKSSSGGVGEAGLFSKGVRNSVGYCGYIFNEDSGLYTVRFRTYSPTLGRWLERDPAGYVDGMGLYEYVRGGPIAAVDPWGLQACSDQGWITANPVDPATGKRILVTYRHVYDEHGVWLGVEVGADTSRNSSFSVGNWGVDRILNWRQRQAEMDAFEEAALCQERKENCLQQIHDAARLVRETTEVGIEVGGTVLTIVIPGPFDEAAVVAAGFKFIGIRKTRAAGEAYAKVRRTCADHLKLSDHEGAIRELAGEIVKLKKSGVPYDHVKEVGEAHQGLRNAIDKANRALANANLCPQARSAWEEVIKLASKELEASRARISRSGRNLP